MTTAVGLSQKKCTRCGEVKDIAAFPRQRTYCRKCHNAQSTKYYRPSRHTESYRIRARWHTQQYRIANPEKVKEQKKRYRKEQLPKLLEEGRFYRSKFPERKRAHDAVKYALSIGKLTREPCFICGEPKADCHHSSYATDMRLHVTWLCRKHHSEVHQ